MSFDTEIVREGQTLRGPARHPAQMLAEQNFQGAPSTHDDDVAAELGLPGAPIEGPTHFSQIDPLAFELWGQRWFESGCISAHFKTMVIEGDAVIASLTDLGEGRAEIAAHKADGTPVLEGTASIDPDAPTALSARLDQLRQNDPGQLHIIDRLEVGDTFIAEDQAIDLTTPNGNGYPFSLEEKLERITEPTPWYRSTDNPWGARVLPFEMYSVLTNKGLGIQGVRRPSNGLFIDLEVRAVEGPLVVGRSYTVEKEVLCIGQSRRVESYWSESRILEPDTARHVATVLLHQGVFKASYPHYPQTPQA